MATPEFARGLRALANEYGALLVLDEIRTNFRVGPSVRGHWASLGEAPDGLDVAPDMSCICKAVANGHPLAALVGGARAREGASIITASGTFWLSGGPMSAALATLDVLEADGSAAMAHMQAMGRLLTDGIKEQAARHDVPITVSGPDAMPFVTFDADDATPAERPRGMSKIILMVFAFYATCLANLSECAGSAGHVWCAAVAEGGSWVHPHHNWYLCLSHTAENIAHTLEATESAFAKLTSEVGSE